jgi:hypothetical protein
MTEQRTNSGMTVYETVFHLGVEIAELRRRLAAETDRADAAERALAELDAFRGPAEGKKETEKT